RCRHRVVPGAGGRAAEPPSGRRRPARRRGAALAAGAPRGGRDGAPPRPAATPRGGRDGPPRGGPSSRDRREGRGRGMTLRSAILTFRIHRFETTLVVGATILSVLVSAAVVSWVWWGGRP